MHTRTRNYSHALGQCFLEKTGIPKKKDDIVLLSLFMSLWSVAFSVHVSPPPTEYLFFGRTVGICGPNFSQKYIWVYFVYIYI